MTRGTKLILALSLFANLGLGYAYLRPHSPASASSSENATTHQTPPPAADWQSLSDATATDDPAFIAKLRAEGFPPHIIAALTRSRITAKYKTRLRELENQASQTAYWRTEPWMTDVSPEARAERRAIYWKIEDESRQLLGQDFESTESDYSRGERIRSFGPIPSAKVAAIRLLQRDYSELTSQVRESMKGVALTEDREKLSYLEKEKRADLIQLLTPDELFEYDKRNSPSASEIKGKLRYFEATEDDFLKLYQLQKAFDEKYGRDNLSGAQEDRRRNAEKELKAQFESALGSERYADYLIFTDGNYSNARYFASENNVPVETAKSLVATQRDFKQRAETIRNNTALAQDQKNRELTALLTEAETKITALVGTDNVAKYKRNAGAWMEKLSPSAKPTPAR